MYETTKRHPRAKKAGPGPAASPRARAPFRPLSKPPNPPAPEPRLVASRSIGTCSKCDGKGYVLTADGAYAKAHLCACQDTCRECSGRGFLLESGENGYLFHKRCPCQDQRRRIERFNRALIPSHFAFRDLNNFESSDQTGHIIEYIRTFARGYPADTNGLLLVGPPGVGKTHLVVGVLKFLTLEKGVDCLFKDFFLLLSEVKTAYETGRFETEVLRPLTEVEVLVVDELGKGRSNSDWEHGLLDEIVCKRYNQMKTTLLTTNFPLEPSRERTAETNRLIYGSSSFRPGQGNLTSGTLLPTLEERIGERIFSRLKQMSTLLRVEASDYRRTSSAGFRSRR